MSPIFNHLGFPRESKEHFRENPGHQIITSGNFLSLLGGNFLREIFPAKLAAAFRNIRVTTTHVVDTSKLLTIVPA